MEFKSKYNGIVDLEKGQGLNFRDKDGCLQWLLLEELELIERKDKVEVRDIVSLKEAGFTSKDIVEMAEAGLL